MSLKSGGDGRHDGTPATFFLLILSEYFLYFFAVYAVAKTKLFTARAKSHC